MYTHVRVWVLVTLVVGTGLLAFASQVGEQGLPEHDRPALLIARGEGIALVVLALLVWAGARFAAARGLDPAHEAPPTRVVERPYATLFVISFVALFVELMLIRYCGAQIRIFSFYKNVPLIGCFLGLGLGCVLGGGRGRHVLLLLLWLIPVAAFLASGSLLLSSSLGKLAAIGSSEHILGDYVPRSSEQGDPLWSQLAVGTFCVATLVVITLMFGLLGRLLGDAFERTRRLPGYTVNIVGSLAGILGFLGMSVLETPPWLWFAAGLIPLLWWLGRVSTMAAVALIAVSVAFVVPDYGHTVWSRYQKLVGHVVDMPGGGPGDAYLVEISDVFYQIAVDRSPQALAAGRDDPFPHYAAVYESIPTPGGVLIVGAGTGNDVAAALHAGAQRVDAVDIDPAIIRMGRLHHPERPYSDERVNVIVDDARHAFRQLTPASYDLVVFGLLDSHTQLGMSSVRLDNYVFTLESLEEARRLVRPGGHVALTAATFQPWFWKRFERMMRASVGPQVRSIGHGGWSTYIAQVEDGPNTAERPAVSRSAPLPSDDWPFLYLPSMAVPSAYLLVVGAMALASVLVLYASGVTLGRFSRYHGHLFFLGAAFLLMEVHAINRLALLFGTTWLVSAVTIALVLLLIVLANLTVLVFPRLPYVLSYAGLAVSLTISFVLEPAAFLDADTATLLGFGLVLLSPVYFAGLVFARSFSVATVAAPAMGANILGSVLGGWIEYGTMALGLRALVLLAASFYLASLLLLALDRDTARRAASRPADVGP